MAGDTILNTTIKLRIMPLQKLRNYLDNNNIRYTNITHSKAYTAQQVAQSAHISGKDMAKTVMINIDGRMAMAVLPASLHIDFSLIKREIPGMKITLASEDDFRNLFPDCEVGTMPPFGNLYDMEVFVDKNLQADHMIAFNAGSHTELIQMDYSDFENLVRPHVINFTVPEGVV